MPALITHDFFGRDVYDRLYTFIGGSRDEADAFPVSYTHLSRGAPSRRCV